MSALLTGDRAWTITHTTVTGSTNADLAAAAGLPNSSVLTTEEQLTGRGRSGRDWFCPAGAGLMFSVLLREPAIPARPSRAGRAPCWDWPSSARWAGSAASTAHAQVAERRPDRRDRAAPAILGEVADGELDRRVPGINVTLALGRVAPGRTRRRLWLGRLAGSIREALPAAILDEFAALLGRSVSARGDVDARTSTSGTTSGGGTMNDQQPSDGATPPWTGRAGRSRPPLPESLRR